MRFKHEKCAFHTGFQAHRTCPLLLSSLSPKIARGKHKGPLTILDQRMPLQGKLHVDIKPLGYNGHEGPWDDNPDDDPFVDHPDQLLGQTIMFNIHIRNIAYSAQTASKVRKLLPLQRCTPGMHGAGPVGVVVIFLLELRLRLRASCAQCVLSERVCVCGCVGDCVFRVSMRVSVVEGAKSPYGPCLTVCSS